MTRFSFCQVDAKNSSGNTSLHWSALNGHPVIVNLLMAGGSSVFVSNEQGRLALDEATAAGHEDIAMAIRVAGQKKVEQNEAEVRHVAW